MASHQALLIIDYTNDFVADKGALTCGEPGQAIDKNIVKIADNMKKDGIGSGYQLMSIVHLITIILKRSCSQLTTFVTLGVGNYTVKLANGSKIILVRIQ